MSSLIKKMQQAEEPERDAEPATFGKAIVQSLEDYERRRARGERLTFRTVEATPAEPGEYDAAAVLAVRERLAVSQPVFAALLALSPATVRAWERGAKTPGPMARRLLDVAARHPEVLGELVGDEAK